MNYKSKTITFGGDLYLNNETFSVSSQIVDIFKGSDYAILNLEAPIVCSGKVLLPAMKAGPTIIQRENTVELLKKLNVRYVSGANNHIFDYGVAGLNETKSILHEHSIASSGFGNNIDEAKQEIDLENSNISIVCTCEEEFGIAEKEMAGSYSMYNDDVLEHIKKLSAAGKFVIMYAHGGGEKVPLPSSYIVKRYRQFIDVGAKLVVAHHPHVIQGFETYNGFPIFYSLGNFIHAKYKRSCGILLTVTIDHKNTISSIKTSYVELRNNDLTFSKKQAIEEYVAAVNKVLSDEESFLKIKQEQAHYMYEGYYKNYFTGLFIEKLPIKIRLYKLMKRFLNITRSNIGKKERDEYTLLHLLRNNSHKEFIETALKLRTKETTDLRDLASRVLWEELIGFIKHE